MEADQKELAEVTENLCQSSLETQKRYSKASETKSMETKDQAVVNLPSSMIQALADKSDERYHKDSKVVIRQRKQFSRQEYLPMIKCKQQSSRGRFAERSRQNNTRADKKENIVAKILQGSTQKRNNYLQATKKIYLNAITSFYVCKGKPCLKKEQLSSSQASLLKQSEEKACKGKEDTPVNKVNQLINPVLRSVSVAEFGLFNHQSNGLIFLRQLQRMLEREQLGVSSSYTEKLEEVLALQLLISNKQM